MLENEGLDDYRSRVVENTKFINLAGIPLPRDKSGQYVPIQMPLDQMYIRILAIEEEQRRSREKEEIGQVKNKIAEELGSRSRDASKIMHCLGEYLYQRDRDTSSAEKPKAIDPKEALKQHKRMVILGAPGSGKSTMLRYFARKAAEDQNAAVPILVSLRDYAAYCDSGGQESLRDFALRQAAEGDLSLHSALEKYDRVFWLVDGLDEARNWRDRAASQIRQMPGDLILTSRPFGYHKTGLESLPHFEIVPLTVDDVGQFIHNWFSVISKEQEAKSEWFEEKVSWLKDQLEGRPRIRRLTQNPLLLTFFMILAGEDPRKDLPNSRAELYRRYVEELLSSWEACRRSKNESGKNQGFRLGDLAEDDAQRAALDGFYYIGWYLHLSYFGGKLDDPATTSESLIKKLCEGRWLKESWALPSGKANVVAKAMIDFWRETGILELWPMEGAEYLAFRHLTFQEYAAAWALKEAWNKDADFTWKFLHPRLHHYAWREPILLLGSMLNQKDLSDLLHRLLDGKSRYERALHRDLFLAGSILNESTNVEQNLRGDIISRIGDLIGSNISRYIIYDLDIPFISVTLRTILHLPFCIWNNIANPDYPINLLGQLDDAAFPYLIPLLTHSDNDVRWSAAWALRNTGDAEAIPYLIPFFKVSDLHACGNTAKAIPYLIPLLNDQDSDVRRNVAGTMGNIGEAEAIPYLIPLLKDSDRWVRMSAADALGKIGEAEAIPYLISSLRDSQICVRRRAATALGNIGGVEVIPYLTPLLKDSDYDTSESATWALINIGGKESIPYLITLLKDTDSRVRGSAADALRNIGEAEAIPYLLPLLLDLYPYVRGRAADALGKIGGADVILFLILLLLDSYPYVRGCAVGALGDIGDAEAIPFLTLLLKDSDPTVRGRTAGALGDIGDAGIIHYLIPLLTDSDSFVRRRAADALGNIGDAKVIHYLIPLLNDSDLYVRVSATSALGNIGEAEAIPHLIPLLKDLDSWVRDSAIEALGNIGEVEAIPHLILLLKDSDSSMHMSAAEALRNIGYAEVIPYLIPLLNDSDSHIRENATEFLRNVGGAEVIPYLIPLLNDSDSHVRENATEFLRNVGGAEVIPYLIPLLSDSDSHVRENATEFLRNVGGAEVIPNLIPLLNDSDSFVRRDAAEALGKVGGAKAIPNLIPLLNDSDSYVREKAVAVVGKAIIELSDYNNVQSIANVLWWRLIDRTDVARSAFRSLMQAANHLAVLEVNELKVIDPLSEVAHEKTKTFRVELIKRIPVAIVALFLVIIGNFISDILADKFSQYIHGKNEIFVLVLFISFLILFLMGKNQRR